MSNPVATRLWPFGTSIFAEMSRLAVEHGAVNLGQGFPDFDGPEFVKEAAIAAIRAGHGQYARMTGIAPLHQALSKKYARDWGLDYPAETHFTVTSGCTEAIAAAILGLCNPGDEVVIFEPYYDSYKASIVLASAVPKVVTLRWPDWRFDPEELERAITPRTRAILVNSPHNPTGKVFSRAELDQIAALCIRHDLVCLSDEVYEHLVFDGVHVPMATLPGMYERTITLSSLGKSFSLTGWKIGWAAAPPALSAAVRAAHQFLTFATATPLQWGAVAALEVEPSYYEDLCEMYRRKRDRLATGLRALGFVVPDPAGTYFISAGIEAFGKTDVEFARWLVSTLHVAVIPPSAFYDSPTEGRNYVRFAFCKQDETLDAALARLAPLRDVS